MAKAAHVQVRRVYDPPEPDDGERVLSKERARLDD